MLVELDKMTVIQISYSYGHNLRVQASCGLENIECKFEAEVNNRVVEALPHMTNAPF